MKPSCRSGAEIFSFTALKIDLTELDQSTAPLIVAHSTRHSRILNLHFARLVLSFHFQGPLYIKSVLLSYGLV